MSTNPASIPARRERDRPESRKLAAVGGFAADSASVDPEG